MNGPIRFVVFDCDGTLVDSQHGIVACMTLAFNDIGKGAPDAAAIRGIVGLSLDHAVAELAPSLSLAEQGAVVAGYKAAFRRSRETGSHGEALYPGAREAIEALEEAGYLLGVATGKSMRGLKAVLDQHGLARAFVTLQTADNAPSKPHPAMLRQAMQEAGAEAAETLMIGDTSFDMAMAVAAGAHPLGVAWGYHPVEALRQTGASDVLGHFDELMPWLAGREVAA
ncbi:HAD-IA family hydrolase [Oceanibacterium hippocampi]|uniref:Pyrophosphatase PpaX n=1 Tax=Oceanibacterium hippocampi TaxID=745714 RepID=A0A1Y5SLN2_9PROT|nr:HAD-IA family hydrolase [Oceanibacterium hippocampi]SLN40527.1 Pyrophosphatase PpaX [Oceanibacterium hippocampi]